MRPAALARLRPEAPRVDDLDRLLAQLRAAGVQVDSKTSEDFNGKFGWAMDPEGNRIDLWEPPEAE